MANKFGIREVTIIGSVVASVFFVISSFSINIDMMLVTYGIMGGSFFCYLCFILNQSFNQSLLGRETALNTR